jgi:hypothetical protein
MVWPALQKKAKIDKDKNWWKLGNLFYAFKSMKKKTEISLLKYTKF